jgi:hypothetical protein
MDESSKQMIGEIREPIPCAPRRPERIDDEYVRNGVAEIFMEVEPLAAKDMWLSLNVVPERIGPGRSRKCLMFVIRMPPKYVLLWII